jgi:hypothetical protein
MAYSQFILGERAVRASVLVAFVALGAVGAVGALSACSSNPSTDDKTGLPIDGGNAGASNGSSGGSVSNAGSNGKSGSAGGGGTSGNAGGSAGSGTGGAKNGGGNAGSTGGAKSTGGNTGSGGAKSTGGASASDGGATCGGRRGNVCAADEYCEYGAGPSCGAADNTGLCTKRPTVCTEDCPGICGCDGKFYCNACGANAAGVPATGDKSCLDDSGQPTCGSDAECGAGLKCCYPCGRVGCKNACTKPLSSGLCPMYP